MGMIANLAASAPSFGVALKSLWDLLPQHERAVADIPPPSSEEDLEPPAGVTTDDWTLAASVLRALRSYTTRPESEWEADLRELGESQGASPESVDALLRVLAAQDRDDVRASVYRARDRLMPILRRTRASVDLRVVRSEKDGLILVPTVLCRIELDEPINDVSALTFQIPFRVLGQIRRDMASLAETLDSLRATLPTDQAPEWVWPREGDLEADSDA